MNSWNKTYCQIVNIIFNVPEVNIGNNSAHRRVKTENQEEKVSLQSPYALPLQLSVKFECLQNVKKPAVLSTLPGVRFIFVFMLNNLRCGDICSN